MPLLDANISRYSFECAGLAPDAFQVVSFRGVEELSQLFQFELHLVSTDPEIAFDDVINRPATFIMMRGQDPVPVNGVVIHLEQSGRTADHFVYRAVLVPRLWLLSLNHGSRVFKDMKTDEIVRKVLEDAGFSAGVDFDFALGGQYEPRPFCVQHQETDLNFIRRLLERDGIAFFFESDGQAEKVVFTEKGDRYPALPDEDVLPYDEHTGMEHERETVYDLVYREQVVTGDVLLADYNPADPSTVQQGDRAGDGMPGRRYEYGGNFPDGGAGKKLAAVHWEEIEARRRQLEGRSGCPAMHAGYTFTLEAYYRATLNQTYLITRVEHSGTQAKALGTTGLDQRGDGATAEEPYYENRFTAIPADVQYRPPRLAPVPVAPGLITATIESNEGDQYAFVDEDGYYHARLHFDLDNPYGRANATQPIRMAQPYSGANYGIHFPNHHNTEVVLACINGDIDRPLALGTVPNPKNRSPVVAENKTQNIIRTHAGNQILIEDQQGVTKISLTTTGGHVMTMDDGGPHIMHATSGGHTLRMDDDGKRVFIHTTDGHGLNMEDEVKVITLFTREGHSLTFNDPDKLCIMQTIQGHTLLMDDTQKIVRLYTTDGHELTLSDQGNKIEIKTKSSDNTMTLDEGAGHITVDAKNQITVKTGESTLDMKKDGTIMLTGKKIAIIGDDEVKISGKKVETTGQQEAKMGVGTQAVTCNNQKVETAGAGITAAAVGVHEISGAMVKIN